MFSTQTATAETNIESNVIYGMHGGLALLMDVYHPETPKGIGIIVIPGSGWHQPMSYDAPALNEKSGYIDWILGANTLLENGYTLFVVNHRAAPTFRFPAAVEDVQRAVRFIRHNAESYKINPDKIGAIGHSSGAHLASMLATMDGASNTNDPSPVNEESAKVQAVVALAPATDLRVFASGNIGDQGAVASFVGTHNGLWRGKDSVKIELNLYDRASPVSYVTSDDAPFLIVHGNADTIVPFEQSQLLLAKLEENNVTAELLVITDGNHSLATAELGRTDTESYYGKMIELFDQYLKNAP